MPALTSLASNAIMLAGTIGAVGDLQQLATDSIMEVAALIAEIKVLKAYNSQRDATCPHWMRGHDGIPTFKCAYHPDLVTCGIEPCINKRAS
jgi:hypothetical protein